MDAKLKRELKYAFKFEGLCELAFSHSSYINESKASAVMSNERLEFLGDAVLEIVVTSYIYDKYPELLEGELTKLRASVVCEPMLAKCARKLSLGNYLKMGRGEDLSGGRERESTLSDLFEAVIGAIYLDGGYDEAKAFIMRNLEEEIHNMRSCFLNKDSKTFLQEFLQRNGKTQIEYNVISESGPEHEKTFEVELLNNKQTLGRGKGKTKKEAEQNAAAQALKKLGK